MAEFRFSPKHNSADKINWHHFSKNTFEKAASEDKPVFLSLSAVWCHWCHVMDETTFSDAEIIDYLNENFICIRVDTDKRPDIQNRYLMNGWPTATFLTDKADVISGSTYMPAHEFLTLSKKIKESWDTSAEVARQRAEERRLKIEEKIPEPVHSELKLSTIDLILDEYQNTFDEKLGGFGNAAKFPAPLTLELFIRQSQIKKNPNLLYIATATLDNMAKGEIYDKEWGGFFRYATERDWSRPHYEKMLSDNASIIMNYLHAFEMTHRPVYFEVIQKSLNYVDTFLANHPNGGFYGSQDADEKFYAQNADKRDVDDMPPIDKVIYTDANAQMVSTYMEAYRILNKSKYLSFAVETVKFLLNNCLTSMGAAHYFTKEEGPKAIGLLPDQIWMLVALIDVFEHDPRPEYLTQANDLVDIIINRLSSNGAFFDKSQTDEDIGNLKVRYRPVRENALLALALQRFSIQSNNKEFKDMARQILSAFQFEQFKEDYISMAPYALALSEVLGEEVEEAA